MNSTLRRYFQNFLKVGIAAGLALAVAMPSYAIAAKPRTCDLLLLRKQLDKNDVPKTLPPLPVHVEIRLGDDEARQIFEAGSALYRMELDDSGVQILKNAAWSARTTGEIDLNQAWDVHQLRAVLKMMRYLFVAISEEHECPDPLDELTIAVGKLRDRARGQVSVEKAKKAGERAREALGDKKIAKIEKAIDNFSPESPRGFRSWIRDEVAEAQAIIEKPESIRSKNHLTPKDVHRLRKIMQSFLAIFQTRMMLKSNGALNLPMNRYLLYVSEKIGAQVGADETAAEAGELDLENGQGHFPDGMRRAVTDFLDSLEI